MKVTLSEMEQTFADAHNAYVQTKRKEILDYSEADKAAPKYLMVAGGNSDQPHLCTGTFQWTDIVHHALRFSRHVDATLFVGAVRYLSDSLPHGETLPGLRGGDISPRVCEHAWMSPECRAIR